MRRQAEKLDFIRLQSLTDELQQDASPQADGDVYTDTGIIGWPYAWQRPAATEEAAWKSVIAGPNPQGWVYVGFPWANLIDGLERKAPIGWKLLRRLENVRKEVSSLDGAKPVATVCQHIHADRFTEFFQSIGVTDLFWPHALKSKPMLDDIRIHGFPLFPAQIGEDLPKLEPTRPRKWLANFIGAFNPEIYLSDVRARIFEDIGKPDLLIVKRAAWHFDRAVYEEQVSGITPDAARLASEQTQSREYLQAIRDSAFTLCPTGSGPNSIRIGEALALGSIPVILTRQLALPGDQVLWEAACLFEEDSHEGYRRALRAMRSMEPAECIARQRAALDLFTVIRPSAYSAILSAKCAGYSGDHVRSRRTSDELLELS